MNPSRTLAFILGATGSGKSTFIDTLARNYTHDIHPIQVGKTLRAKYGEAYFKGQAAPEHTQEEAWQLVLDGVCYGVDMNIPHIVVDGQPRDVEQMERLESIWPMLEPKRKVVFIHLFAPYTIRQQRVEQRDKDNEARINLARARLLGDYEPLYYIVSKLCNMGMDVRHFDTSMILYSPLTCFKSVVKDLFL